MAEDCCYLVPAQKTRTVFKVQGSKFIASLVPVNSENAVENVLNGLSKEFPDATHHPYAYRIGIGSYLIERVSDDREPAGSAGAPMLQVLSGRGISDAIVVGTRYFGGTRLGLGGLTRAYRDCARLVLEETKLLKKEPLEKFALEFNYEDLGLVTRLVENLEAKIIDTGYGEKVTLRVQLPSRLTEEFTGGFVAACRGKGSLNKF